MLDGVVYVKSGKIGRFTSADTIIPPMQGVQAWDWYAYVNNSPVMYTDPTGHCMNAMMKSASKCGGGGGGGSSTKPPASSPQAEEDTPQCGYHHCVVEENLYEVGWENFDQAWDIYWHPNATYGQRFVAGAYMSYWGGAHACLVICTGVAATEFLIPGLISCIGNPACQAALSQGNKKYPGVDNWVNVILPKGSVVWGGSPGQSNFYTNTSSIRASGTNVAKLYDGLQVAVDKVYGYRQGVTQYIVTKDIKVAQSIAVANTDYGVGGFTHSILHSKLQ